MRRNIKFRAWGPNCKTMWNWEEVKNLISQLGWGGEKIHLQFTGIEDRNGTDIYDGDIVAFFDMEAFEVEQEESGAWMMKGLYEELNERKSEILVIGNIYENPEILKKH